MRNTVPRPKVPLKGKLYEEVDGVRYPLRVPTPEITGHPIAGEEIDGVWYAIEEEEYVSEDDWHAQLLVSLVYRISGLVPGSARVFTDVMLYWEEANGKKKLAPDLMVLPVVEEPHRKRGSVRLWEEVSWPSFVLEVLSDSTSERDYEEKYLAYQEELRVPEYFLCDPERGQEQVWGYRLEGGEYREIEADAAGRVWSEQLQAWLGADSAGVLQVWDWAGQQVPDYEQVLEERDRAREEWEAVREEWKVAREERNVAQEERDAAREERAEAEQRTMRERQRAEEETNARAIAEQRAEALEAELRELRARLQGPNPS